MNGTCNFPKVGQKHQGYTITDVMVRESEQETTVSVIARSETAPSGLVTWNWTPEQGFFWGKYFYTSGLGRQGVEIRALSRLAMQEIISWEAAAGAAAKVLLDMGEPDIVQEVIDRMHDLEGAETDFRLRLLLDQIMLRL